MVCNTLSTACLHLSTPLMDLSTPLMEMVCNRFRQPVKLPKTICNRFRQPLMETVCNRLSSYLPCYATAYGNGVSPPKIPRTAAQASQGLSCLIKFFSRCIKPPSNWISLNNIVFGAQPSEFSYFPNCTARDKSYIPLHSPCESDFSCFLLWPGKLSLNFDLKLASCSRYFGILGQKMWSPQGATEGVRVAGWG
jgi:hypothetical protein